MPERREELTTKGGLDVISITDHDTAAAVEVAQRAASGSSLRVIPGVELSSTHEGRDVHVLGYFVDPAAPALVAHADRAGRRREERMREMISRLGDQVRFLDTPGGGRKVMTYTLTRQHLASEFAAAGSPTSPLSSRADCRLAGVVVPMPMPLVIFSQLFPIFQKRLFFSFNSFSI